MSLSDNIAAERHNASGVDNDSHGDGHHHIITPGTYLVILLILFVLTAITVAAAYINWGHPILNLVIALGIAVVKCFFVIYWFMHVKYSEKVIKLCIGISLLFLATMIFGTLMDVLTREAVTPAGYNNEEVQFVIED